MTTLAYTLLRDAEHRAEVAELAELLRLPTDAALYRSAVKLLLKDARAKAAELSALDAQEEAAEEVADLVLCESLGSSAEPPADSPESIPPNPAILEWLEEEDEPDEDDDEQEEEQNPWLDEEEALQVITSEEGEALEELATSAAFGELTDRREGLRLVARLFCLLVALKGAPEAARIRADIEHHCHRDSLPAELWGALLSAANLRYPLRE